MQKRSLYLSLLVALIVAGLYSCSKKSNTINNGQVIETPYSLFFTDTAGGIYNSTDGKTITKTVFTPDGFPARALTSSNNNLLVVKPNIYANVNNSPNFNPAYNMLDQYLHYGANGHLMGLDQSMIMDVPAWNHVYVASADPSSQNYFGIAWSAGDGIIGTWFPENYYDTDQILNTSNIHVSSFALLKNNTLVAHDTTNRAFYRTDISVRWKESLPGASLLPTDGYFSLGHINNQLIAIDTRGNDGAYYSDDLGANWAPYSGLPVGVPLLSICSPFEQLCFVGTDGDGLYVLNPGTSQFQRSNSGLPTGLIVRGITFKENIFKNDTRQQYVYLATNKGIYQSADMGLNWVKTISGNFVTIH